MILKIPSRKKNYMTFKATYRINKLRKKKKSKKILTAFKI